MKKLTLFLIAFLLFQIVGAQNKIIKIHTKRNSDRSIDFFYEKNVPGTYYLHLDFTRLENSSSKNTYKKVLKQNSGSLFTLFPSDEYQGISYSYHVKYKLRYPNSKVNHDITYLLPFKTGSSRKITQKNSRSFVTYPKELDTVYSMRRGIVVKLIQSKASSKNNKLLIEHKDGSYAYYAGFEKGSIFVKLGQKVYPHTKLGKLGTHNEQGSKLKFSVYHYIEIPTNDKDNTEEDTKLKKIYLSPNFLTNNSTKKIKSEETYKAMFNNEIKLQEFSRREKKKYKKNPNMYN